MELHNSFHDPVAKSGGTDADRACPACDAAGARAVVIGTLDKTGKAAVSRDRYTLVRCPDCDLVFLTPLLSTNDLRALYVDKFQFKDDAYREPSHVKIAMEYIGQCLERLLAAAGRLPDESIRVLEIGAGLAWMCRAAKTAQPMTKTVAQDVTAEVVEECTWVDRYVHGDVGDLMLDAEGPYDIISLTHVIEHVVDPQAMIRRCAQLLATGGRIFLTAPHRPPGFNERPTDIELWRSYSYNHVPAHVQYFSRDSMARLADGAGCVLDYWCDTHEQGQAFEAWLRGNVLSN
jgi:SAM-dependent methyltransferase